MFQDDDVMSLPGMLLKNDVFFLKGGLSGRLSRKKTSFRKKDVFSNDVRFLERRLF
jgi:hypothetical protein